MKTKKGEKDVQILKDKNKRERRGRKHGQGDKTKAKKM